MHKSRLLISAVGLAMATYITDDAEPSRAVLRTGPDCDTGVVTMNFCDPDNPLFMEQFATCPDDQSLMNAWCNSEDMRSHFGLQESCDEKAARGECASHLLCYSGSPNPADTAFYLQCQYGVGSF